MFRDKETASKISKIMLNVSELLDGSVSELAVCKCLENEKEAYYRVVGQLMGIIGIDVLNQIYRMHPDIKPDDYMLPEDFKE
jgi:hypothetical protein